MFDHILRNNILGIYFRFLLEVCFSVKNLRKNSMSIYTLKEKKIYGQICLKNYENLCLILKE